MNRPYPIRATKTRKLNSPVLESSSHLHGAGNENLKRKFSRRAKEMQHDELTKGFPSGHFEEREEVDITVVRCGFCEVKW